MAPPSDIIVVGAGIVGCAVAHELASRGASVEIIDERPIGMGATQASAGVLAPYIEARDGSPLLDLTVRSLALFDDFVERVVAESGMTVTYRRTGTLDAAFNDGELQALRATAATLDRLDVPALLLDAAAARERGTAPRRRRHWRAADRVPRFRRCNGSDARAWRRGAPQGRAAHRRQRRADASPPATATSSSRRPADR